MIISSNLIRAKIFISYSHQDVKFLKELHVQLAPVVRDRHIDLWDDTRLVVCANWRSEINSAIQSAKVAVLLVSANFLGSEFMYSNELLPLLSAAKSEGIIILPVLLNPCAFKHTPLVEFQFVNKSLTPLKGMTTVKRDETWVEVVEAIVEAFKAPLPLSALPSNISIQQKRSRLSAGRAAARKPGEESNHDRDLKKESQTKIEHGEYDVFLCHNNEDKSAVKKIGEQLKDKGYVPWLDTWDLIPGRSKQSQVQKQIENIRSAAVFIGKNGIAPWHEMEIEALLHQFIKRGCPVIPTLLEGVSQEPELPLFLAGMNWVKFHKPKPSIQAPFPEPTLPLQSEIQQDKEEDDDGREIVVSYIDVSKYEENDEIIDVVQNEQMAFNKTFTKEDDQDFYLGLDPIELLICGIEGIPPSIYQSRKASNS
jgi:hypothetical protein